MSQFFSLMWWNIWARAYLTEFLFKNVFDIVINCEPVGALHPPLPLLCSSSGWRLTSFLCHDGTRPHHHPNSCRLLCFLSLVLLLLGRSSADVGLVDPNLTPVCPFLPCCQISGHFSHLIALQTRCCSGLLRFRRRRKSSWIWSRRAK